jgi:hypothetical protein
MKYGYSSLVPARFQIAEIEQRHMKERAFKELAANIEDGKSYCITYTAEGEYKPELDAYELKAKLKVTEPTIKDCFIGIDRGSRVKKCFGDYIPDFRKKREKRRRGWQRS